MRDLGSFLKRGAQQFRYHQIWQSARREDQPRSLFSLCRTPKGSLAELDTQLIIAIELEYCARSDANDIFELIGELRRMLNFLRRKLIKK